MKHRIDPTSLHRVHIAVDLVLVSLGWIGAWALRSALAGPFGAPINPLDAYASALPLIAVPWVFSCWIFGLYRTPRSATFADSLQSLLRSVALGLLVVSTISFFFRELAFGRAVVLLCAASNLVLQGASRALFHRWIRALRRSGRGELPVLVVGSGVTAIRLLQKLQDHPEIGYRVVGLLTLEAPREAKDIAGIPVLGGIAELRRITRERGVAEVFMAEPSLSHARMLSLVLDCEDQGLTFRCVTNLFEVLTAGTPVELVDDLPLVRLGRERPSLLYEPVKRAFDLALSALGLVALAPLFAFIAWRVRATSPGPALFVQQRVGRDGAPFSILKFRTMRSDVAAYEPGPATGADPRVTPVGRWLRATSLDELPQLVNVLRGEMSLVGPRPEMPFIAAGYDAWQRRRLSVPPGLTGLWQILGRKDLPMHENLQYDFYYIRNRSLVLDAWILLKTIGVVWSRRGAF
jgi:exopolysaccharide biosynthesis polyprenyl glycosylphosphotransferase